MVCSQAGKTDVHFLLVGKAEGRLLRNSDGLLVTETEVRLLGNADCFLLVLFSDCFGGIFLRFPLGTFGDFFWRPFLGVLWTFSFGHLWLFLNVYLWVLYCWNLWHVLHKTSSFPHKSACFGCNSSKITW